jgi:hypothetical protein
MKAFENVILGGGASGLILADKLQNYDTAVISREIGGLLSSYWKNSFFFDVGGHVYTSQDENVVSLMKEAQGTFHPQRKAFYLGEKSIWGELTEFPVQSSHLFPINPPAQMRFQFSFEDFGINTFGSKFCYSFFFPFNFRVWTVEPSELDFDWIEGRVQLPDENKKDWGMNASFWYARGDNIIKRLLTRTKAQYISGYIVSVDRNAHTVLLSDGELIRYKNLFVTTNYFNDFPKNVLLSVGIGLNRQLDEADFHWVYPEVHSPIHRVTLLSRYCKGMAPPGCDSLLLELYSGPQISQSFLAAQMMAAKNEESRKFVAKSMLNASGFGTVALENIEVVWSNQTFGYPIQVLNVREQVAKLKAELLRDDVYLCGRWGSHGYFNLQHLYKDAEAAVAMTDIANRELVNDYLFSKFYYRS